MVALTGIEPDRGQFSSVQLGLSSCVFSPVGIPRWSETPPRTADVTAQSQRTHVGHVHATVRAHGTVVAAGRFSRPLSAVIRKNQLANSMRRTRCRTSCLFAVSFAVS